MSNPMQDLHTLGLNPFAVTLLAESMLKSAYVKHRGAEPLTFEFPVRRGDCEGWAGVRITIEAVPTAASGVTPTAEAEQCWCDKQGIGEPGVSCGDCPTRDYKPRGVMGTSADKKGGA